MYIFTGSSLQNVIFLGCIIYHLHVVEVNLGQHGDIVAQADDEPITKFMAARLLVLNMTLGIGLSKRET